ncbi:hypothetical protein LZ683_21150 [Comamonas testosteroni]|uniref:hypothetical protein n=1 Tax=Comamonas testosteroni TaxID=285 RepID=UPI0023AABC21|nr:hypothetical protein [Comamonas testosteroni]WEE76629.1 hypothetical protein LZ683_21150 [Comamonas testosteroni]
MNGVQISSDKQNRTVHKASIDETALLALAIDHVAQQLGLDSTAANVQVRAYVTSYQVGSLGDRKARIEVELIEGHEAANVALSAS